MSNEEGKRLLLADSCVLIDFLDACPEILSSLARDYAVVHVASPILEEVEGLDSDGCAAAGLVVIEPTSEQLSEAVMRREGLSFQDWLCLVVSRDGGMTCVTNDRRLRKACGRAGVATMRGLRCLLELAREGHISKDEARTAADRLHGVDPLYIDARLIAAFRARLDAGS